MPECVEVFESSADSRHTEGYGEYYAGAPRWPDLPASRYADIALPPPRHSYSRHFCNMGGMTYKTGADCGGQRQEVSMAFWPDKWGPDSEFLLIENKAQGRRALRHGKLAQILRFWRTVRFS